MSGAIFGCKKLLKVDTRRKYTFRNNESDSVSDILPKRRLSLLSKMLILLRIVANILTFCTGYGIIQSRKGI